MKNWKIILLFTVVILFTFSSIVLSGLWKDKSTIRSVELNGNITLSKEELFDFAKINDSLICSNQLSLDIIETRLAKHPNIKKVVVLKEGTAVKIDITEKNPFAAATNGSDMFLIDDQLTLYPVKKEHSNIDLPVISGLSSELGPNTYSNNDLNNLKIAQYIISQSIKLNKSLFNYISEINFSDSSCLVIITSDDATPVYLLDYSSVENLNRSITVSRDINNTMLRRAIDKKLVQLNGFLKQVRVYKTLNSFRYIDLRFKDLVIIKNNTEQAE
ncbi:MAG: Cell division protein FtsQ [Chlorobi bacterium OLB5]|nr:MAG: Cell division protein FtsQ [Chlorobi bacterium OLB5]